MKIWSCAAACPQYIMVCHPGKFLACFQRSVLKSDMAFFKEERKLVELMF